MAQSSTQTCTETHQETSSSEVYELRGISPEKNGPKEQHQSNDSKSVDIASPPNAHFEIERWNSPKSNSGRLIFAFISFIIAGMNDAAVGVR